jgi:hypothetical protein
VFPELFNFIARDGNTVGIFGMFLSVFKLYLLIAACWFGLFFKSEDALE